MSQRILGVIAIVCFAVAPFANADTPCGCGQVVSPCGSAYGGSVIDPYNAGGVVYGGGAIMGGQIMGGSVTGGQIIDGSAMGGQIIDGGMGIAVAQTRRNGSNGDAALCFRLLGQESRGVHPQCGLK